MEKADNLVSPTVTVLETWGAFSCRSSHLHFQPWQSHIISELRSPSLHRYHDPFLGSKGLTRFP